MKNNTGNGGIRIWVDEKTSFDVTFSPSVNSDDKISLKLRMDFWLPRPGKMIGMSFNEMLEDETLASALYSLDSVISSILKSESWCFSGKSIDGITFTSYIDSLRYIHDCNYLDSDITDNPEFWITLGKPSHFEDDRIVDIITKLLIANYDFRKTMSSWNKTEK